MTVPATSSSRPQLLAPYMEPAHPPSPIRDLTAGLARGDDVWWCVFHRDYGPGIFRHLLALTRGDHDLASEALQQTYLRVARHARPCEVEAMFVGWVRVVTRSVLHDCLRRRRSFGAMLRRRQAEPRDDGADSELEERMLRALEVALTGLDPADRSLLEAKYFSGADVRSLAVRLQVSPKAVESRLSRARAELRGQFTAALARHE